VDVGTGVNETLTNLLERNSGTYGTVQAAAIYRESPGLIDRIQLDGPVARRLGDGISGFPNNRIV